MRYDFLPCPVCKVPFGEKNEDIVVCPICGTPHHRECYKSLNHCVNENKHSEGFVWVNPMKTESHLIKPVQKPVNSIFSPNENRNNENANAARQPFQTNPQYRPISGDELIGDIKVKTFADYIKVNIPSYIPKFLKMEKLNKKVSWNWAAFLIALIFPPGWFFYRKMYKEGILLAIFCYIIPLVFMGNNYEYSVEIYKLMGSGASLKSDAAFPAAPLSYKVSIYIDLISILFSGMFANKLYLGKIKREILKFRGKAANEAEFDEMIMRKGGVTVGFAILAFAVYYAVFYAVELIYTKYGFDVAYFISHLLALIAK